MLFRKKEEKRVIELTAAEVRLLREGLMFFHNKCLHFQTVFHHQKSIPVLFQGSTCTTFLRGFPARYRFFMLHSHRLLVLQRK